MVQGKLQLLFSSKSLPEIKIAHALIIQSGFTENVCAISKLISAYGKVKVALQDARKLFEEIPKKNVISYTAIISAYAKHEIPRQALPLFSKMQKDFIMPDAFTIPCTLSACAKVGDLYLGRQIHHIVIRNGFQNDSHAVNALIDMYFRCQRAEDARQVFDEMSYPDLVTWNTVIVGYVDNGLFDLARKFLMQVPRKNLAAWNAMILGYVRRGEMDLALKLFDIMPERDEVSWNALIAGHMQCGQVDKARTLFDKMPNRGVISWNHMISGLAKNGLVVDALKIFQRMPNPDPISWNTMLAGYVQNGCLHEALDFFWKMPEKTVISWNTMIARHSRYGVFNEALELFRYMQRSGCRPDAATFASGLSACASSTAALEGKIIHASVIKCGFVNQNQVGNALVDMYAKCGNLDRASLAFDEICDRDVVSWNVMIGGYAMHGLAKEAVQVFKRMEGLAVKPNPITFVKILNACCHVGLLETGQYYFNSMIDTYGIEPLLEHYCCIVDLLGRAGKVNEAYDFIKDMPISPSATIWASLLTACKKISNLEIGGIAADSLLNTCTENPSHNVLISNLYSAMGRYNDAEKIWAIMNERGIRKKPGCSWLEGKDKKHTFLFGDRNIPQKERVYAELERLSGQMKDAGCVPAKSLSLHDIEEGTKGRQSMPSQ